MCDMCNMLVDYNAELLRIVKKKQNSCNSFCIPSVIINYVTVPALYSKQAFLLHIDNDKLSGPHL